LLGSTLKMIVITFIWFCECRSNCRDVCACLERSLRIHLL